MEPQLLADRVPPPRLRATTCFCAPYVDNGNVVAGSASAAQSILDAVKRELSSVGFVYHEEVEPTRTMELLGRTLALEAITLRPSRRRLWRLWHALDALDGVSLVEPAARARAPRVQQVAEMLLETVTALGSATRTCRFARACIWCMLNGRWPRIPAG